MLHRLACRRSVHVETIRQRRQDSRGADPPSRASTPSWRHLRRPQRSPANEPVCQVEELNEVGDLSHPGIGIGQLRALLGQGTELARQGPSSDTRPRALGLSSRTADPIRGGRVIELGSDPPPREGVVRTEDWPFGLRCMDCDTDLPEGHTFSERPVGMVGDTPVTEVVCVRCGLPRIEAFRDVDIACTGSGH